MSTAESDGVASDNLFRTMLHEAQQGSSSSLGELLQSYRNYLLLLADTELGSDLQVKVSASDVVQDSCLEAQRDFGQFTGTSPGEFRAWLRRLLLNNVSNVIRGFRGTEKRNVSREVGMGTRGTDSVHLDIADQAPSVARLAIKNEQLELLRRAIKQLPQQFQDVIQWRNYERASFEVIGGRMNRSHEAARKIWVRAIETLQQELDFVNDQQRPDLETQLSELLEKYDESLSANGVDSAAPIIQCDQQLQRRYQKLQGCLQLLEMDRRQQEHLGDVDDLRMSSESPDTEFHAPGDLAGYRQVARFQILRQLGSGGFGVVFLAEDPVLRRRVALKIPRMDIVATPDLQRRFLQESQIAAGLAHPHLVPVFEAGQAGVISYQVTEYCAGGTLASWLWQRDARSEGETDGTPGLETSQADQSCPQRRLPVKAAVELMLGLSEGVQYAHEHGILHRDLKPGNILLHPRGDANSVAIPEMLLQVPLEDLCRTFQPMISDFGLAKMWNSVHRPADSAAGSDTPDVARTTLAGTPQYMAPEQVTGDPQRIGPGTDIYGLGALLYEVLAGRPVFLKKDVERQRSIILSQLPIPLRQLRGGIPRDLEAICLKCLEKEISNRYASAGDLVSDLRAFQRGEPVSARRWPLHEQFANWSRRNPAVALLLLAAGCMVLGLIGFGAWHLQELDAANSHLRSTVTELEHQTTVANQERQRATDQTLVARRQREVAERLSQRSGELEWIARQRQYSAAMIRAGDLWHKHQWSALSSVLQEFLPDRDTPPADSSSTSVCGFEWRYLWNQASHLLQLNGHSNDIRAAAMTPDGSQCYSLSDDGTLRHWRLDTGRLLRTVSLGEPGRILGADFSADTRRAVMLRQLIPEQACELTVWDLELGMVLQRIESRSGSINCAAIAPDGAWVALGGNSDRSDTALLRLLNVSSGVLRTENIPVNAAYPPYGIIAITISPAGHEMAVSTNCVGPGSSWHHRLLMTKLHSGNQNPERSSAGLPASFNWSSVADLRPGLGTHLQFSADGRQLAYASRNPNQVELWDVTRLERLSGMTGLPDVVDAVAFESNSRLAVAGMFAEVPSDTRSTSDVASEVASDPGPRLHPDLILWNWRNDRRESGSFSTPVILRCLQFNQSTESWIIGAIGGRLSLWRPEVMPKYAELTGHQPTEAWGIAFSPDSRRLYSAGDDSCLRIWNVESGNEIAKLQQHTSLVSCVAASPDGRWIATGSYDDDVILWRTEDFQVHAILKGHTHDVRTVAFSPDSQVLASSGRDGVVHLWSVPDHRLIETYPGDGSHVRALVFSSNRSFAEVNSVGQIADTRLGGQRQILRTEGQEVHCLGIAPAGTNLPIPPAFVDEGAPSRNHVVALGELLLYGEKYGAVKLLHVPTRSIWLEQSYPGTDIRSVAIAPDGRTFAVAGDDRAVHLWHLASGQELLTFADLPAAVNQVAFSPDGRYLAAALHNGAVRIWSGATVTPIP